MNDRSTLLLEHHLKELKLPSFLREYGKMAAQCAAEGVDHPQYLLRLAELELLFEVFSQRYERGSTMVTTNLPFDEWTEVFGSERLTGALLDRLTHHVHILEMNGESFRLKHSRDNSPGQALDDLDNS